MVSFPNAKINLGLNILSKRSDGYHNISSCFLPVGWRDALEIIPASDFCFTSSGLSIPGDSSANLCVKAYELLKTDYDLNAVHIHLHKSIPMGAGLGGGSADGAFALKMLNDIFELNLATVQLQRYAKQLGADCPFFIENKPTLVSGIGEIFEEVELSLDGVHVVIVNPGIHVPTKIAFAKVSPSIPEMSVAIILETDDHLWQSRLKNDFEPSVFESYPQIEEIKYSLYKMGAFYASMTGSGASVFGLFRPGAMIDQISTSFSKYTVWKGKLLV